MTVIEPSTVTAKLVFSGLPPAGQRAYVNINHTSYDGDSEADTNVKREKHDVVIENLRGKEDQASLDTTGFQLVKKPTKVVEFATDEEIVNDYYPESIEYIKEITGASRVVLFDHTIRRRRPGVIADSPEKRQPVSNAHIDQTNASAVNRVHRHLPAEEVPELLKHRFQIINLWRPISHPALDWPLTLCDYRSVDPKTDIVPIALIYPDREGEINQVRYSPNHKWKYFRGMTPEEFVLIKCYDSLQDGRAVFTPHTAFADPSTPADAPLRESIELRALVFYDN